MIYSKGGQYAAKGDICVMPIGKIQSSSELSKYFRNRSIGDHEIDCLQCENSSILSEIDNCQATLQNLVENFKSAVSQPDNKATGQAADKETAPLSGIIEKVENGIMDAKFIQMMIQSRKICEAAVLKALNENEELLKRNRMLKSNLEKLESDRYNRVINFVTLIEERKKWKFWCSITRCDNDFFNSTSDLESSLKNLLFSYKDSECGRVSSNIRDWFMRCSLALCENKALESFELLNLHSLDANNSSNLANCIQSNLYMVTSLFLAKNGHSQEAIDSANQGLELRRSLNTINNKCTAGYLNFLSFVYWNIGDQKTAIQKAYEALRYVEDLFKSPDNSKKLALYYMLTGSLLKHYGLETEGLHLIELSALCLNSLLPKEDGRWLAVMSKLARMCNSVGKFDDALNVCNKVLSYLETKKYPKRESEKGVKLSIMEIAANYNNYLEPNSTKLSLMFPPPMQLTFPQICIFEEVIHSYFNKKKVMEAKIIEHWLRVCQRYSETAREHDVRNKLNSKLRRYKGQIRETDKAGIIPLNCRTRNIPNITVILDLRTKYSDSKNSPTKCKDLNSS